MSTPKSTKKARKTSHISDEDRALFRAAIGDIQPIEDDRVQTKTLKPTDFKQADSAAVARRRNAQAQARLTATDPFSDDFMPALPEGTLAWVADQEAPYLAKQLRRGDFAPGMVLDLHGYTRVKARRELAEAIQACMQEGLNCLNVIHGIGHGILRQQVPAWLMQHPDVRALHQAPLEWGGQGALLVLLRVPE